MRALLYIPLALLLFASIPWIFTEGSEKRLFGFPAWAVYSLAMSILYACVVSTFVWRFWDNGDDSRDAEEKPKD